MVRPSAMLTSTQEFFSDSHELGGIAGSGAAGAAAVAGWRCGRERGGVFFASAGRSRKRGDEGNGQGNGAHCGSLHGSLSQVQQALLRREQVGRRAELLVGVIGPLVAAEHGAGLADALSGDGR